VAKLYYNREAGMVTVRPDDELSEDDLIEITPEQGVAVALSTIANAISNLYDVLDDKLGSLSRT
jgi:hypothetical protein